MKFNKETKEELKNLLEKKNIGLEGNILKIIDASDDPDFAKYVEDCKERDKETRKKRLEITKQVQEKNKELLEVNAENERIMSELQSTFKEVEDAKITFEVQNRELIAWKQDNERISLELQQEMAKSELARIGAEEAKTAAINDLDVLQKKKQTELIGNIVRIALGVIISIGIITTFMYILALIINKDTQMIGSTWSNMLGILLTNAFSIIGTIMGVKYSGKEDKE
jgi:ABC-type anion transport system duplicated permease subunit